MKATGNHIVGTDHAAKILKEKKHLILVNVEADITCGKYLSDLAKENGVICSMAYGDQPSLILEQIEWARLNGFEVICAGKGTKYHPSFEYSTPDTVWGHYGLTKERAENESGMNPKMFNSFLCGDKSAIEMCAVSNAANLKCPSNGLTFPPVGVYDIAKKLIPKKDGGLIDFEGQVEVISSIDLNKKDIPNDLRWGVYIVIKAQNEYVKNCFKDYGMVTDSSGNYSAIWRPYHYIGLELAQSIYSIALDNRATGYTKKYNTDVASVAKKDLKVGEKLDGEGGFCARGKLITSQNSKNEMILPLGLTDNAILKKNINKDIRAGYTNSGTHRSDFYVYSHDKPVRESGSMSTLIIACLIINLARINVFHVKHGFKPILLVDDLFFGIDKKNLTAVVKLLVYIKGNIVLTAPNIYIDILKQVCQESNDIEIINMEQRV